MECARLLKAGRFSGKRWILSIQGLMNCAATEIPAVSSTAIVSRNDSVVIFYFIFATPAGRFRFDLRCCIDFLVALE